jgi:hypothetical protein
VGLVWLGTCSGRDSRWGELRWVAVVGLMYFGVWGGDGDGGLGQVAVVAAEHETAATCA